MKKVYVVKVKEAYEMENCISAVFTSRKKAIAYIEYWNSKQEERYYWLCEHEITTTNYNKIPF